MTRQIWKIELYGYRESPPESQPVQASDDTSNDTLCDSPLLDLQTPDPYTRISWQLQWHPAWRQPGIGSANPQLYTNQKITPPTTPCVTAPPRNESTKSANPHPQTWSKNPYS